MADGPSHGTELRIAETGLPDECERWLLHLRVLAVGNNRLKATPKLVWQFVWNKAGCRPGRVVVDLTEMGKVLGLSRSTINDCLQQLYKLNLATLCHWHGTAQPRLEVCDPAEVLVTDPNQPILRVMPCDPQRWLPLDQERNPERDPVPETESRTGFRSGFRSAVGAPSGAPGGETPLGPGPRPGPSPGPGPGPALDFEVGWDFGDGDRCHEILRLANEVHRKVWRSGRRLSPQDRSLVLKACVLSESVLSEAWLQGAVEAARSKRTPAAYLHMALAGAAWDSLGGEPKNEHLHDRKLLKQWFGRLLKKVTIPEQLVYQQERGGDG